MKGGSTLKRKPLQPAGDGRSDSNRPKFNCYVLAGQAEIVMLCGPNFADLYNDAYADPCDQHDSGGHVARHQAGAAQF